MASSSTSIAGPGKGPQLTLSGKEALAAVAKVLPTATPYTYSAGAMGDVVLKPGTIWEEDKLLVYAGPLQVYYTAGNKMYEDYTPDFVRDRFLTAFAKGGASAEWIIPIAKAEFAFIQALLAPTWVVVGIAIAKGVGFYVDNRAIINIVVGELKSVRGFLREFEKRFPKLYAKLFSKQTAWFGLKEALKLAVQNVGAADILYFLGRVLGVEGLMKGKGGFLPAAEEAGKVTITSLIKLGLYFGTLVAIVHFPELVAKGIEKKIEDLRQSLEKAGVPTTKQEAQVFFNELHSKIDTEQFLNDMKAMFDDVTQRLQSLQRAAAKYAD